MPDVFDQLEEQTRRSPARRPVRIEIGKPKPDGVRGKFLTDEQMAAASTADPYAASTGQQAFISDEQMNRVRPDIFDQISPLDVFDEVEAASFSRPGAIPNALGIDPQYQRDFAAQQATQEIAWRNRGTTLQPRPNADGTTDYVRVDAQQQPAPLNDNEKRAIYSAYESDYTGEPIQQPTEYDAAQAGQSVTGMQIPGLKQGYEVARNVPGFRTGEEMYLGNETLQDFGGSMGQTMGGTGAGLIGAALRPFAPNVGRDLSEGVQGGYAYDPDSTAAFLGGVAGNVAPLIPAIAIGGPVAGNVTAGVLGASQFGNVINDIARRRQAGEQISVQDELTAAALSAAAEFAGERIGLGAMTRAAGNAFKNKVAQAVMDYAVTAGVNATEEMATQIAQNAVQQRFIDPEQEITEGVGQAGLAGALVGAAGRGIHDIAHLRPKPNPPAQPRPTLDGAPAVTDAEVNDLLTAGTRNATASSANAADVEASAAHEVVAERPDIPSDLIKRDLLTWGRDNGPAGELTKATEPPPEPLTPALPEPPEESRGWSFSKLKGWGSDAGYNVAAITGRKALTDAIAEQRRASAPAAAEPIASPTRAAEVMPERQPLAKLVNRRHAAIQRATKNHPDSTFDLAPVDESQSGMQREMSKRGVSVVFYDRGPRNANQGFVLSNRPGVLFVDRNQPVESVRQSVIHEFGHELQLHHPELFERLQSVLSDEQIEAAVDAAVQRAGVADAGESRVAAEAQVIPLEAIANDPRIIEVLEARHPTLWQRIKGAFRRFLDRFTGSGNPLLDEAVKVLRDTRTSPLYASDEVASVEDDGAELARAEVTIPETKYGYWYEPAKGWRVVDEQAHEDAAAGMGFKGTSDALDKGAVRVVAKPKSGELSLEVSGRHTSALDGVRGMVRDALADEMRVVVSVLGEGYVTLDGGNPRKSQEALKFNSVVNGTFTEYAMSPKTGATPANAAELKRQAAARLKALRDTAAAARGSARKATPIPGEAKSRWMSRDLQDVIAPIASRIRDVSPRVFGRLIEYDLAAHRRAAHDKAGAYTLVSRLHETLGKEGTPKHEAFKLAWLNRDIVGMKELLPEESQSSLDLTLDILKRIHKDQTEAGVKVGFLDDYLPRRVIDAKGLKESLGNDDKGIFDEAYARATSVKGAPLTAEERNQIASDVVAGYGPRKPGGTGPAHARTRSVETVTPEQAKFYDDPIRSLLSYIDAAAKATERAKFLGKGDDPAMLQESIGNVITEADSTLNAEDQAELKALLQTRLVAEMLHMPTWATTTKKLIYATTITRIASGISQLTDVATSGWRFGVHNTAKAMKDALHITPGEGRIVLHMLGFDHMGQEFLDPTRISHAVGFLEKMKALPEAAATKGLHVGTKFNLFQKIDVLMKETQVNAALHYMEDAATDPSSVKFRRLQRDWQPVLGEQRFDAAMGALRRKDVWNEDVQLLAFAHLTEMQPVTLSNMPAMYLRMQKGRLFYTLHTYQLQQLDHIRRQIVRRLKTPGQRREGLEYLAGLLAFGLLAGLGRDLLKDLINGKDLTHKSLAERSGEAALGLFGLNRYVALRFTTNPLETLAESFFIPPVTHFDAPVKDVMSMGDDRGFESPRMLPLVGDLIYFWSPWGKGRTLNAEEAKRVYRERLRDLRREAYLARQAGDHATARDVLKLYNERRTEGPGDGRKEKLTFDDLRYPPSEETRGAAKAAKAEAAEALRHGDEPAARDALREVNKTRRMPIELDDLELEEAR